MKKIEKMQVLNDIEFIINCNSNFYDVIEIDGKKLLRDLDTMEILGSIKLKKYNKAVEYENM